SNGAWCMPRIHSSPEGVTPKQILIPETVTVERADGTRELRARIWNGFEWKSQLVALMKEYHYPCGDSGDFTDHYRTEYLFAGGRWYATFKGTDANGV